VALERARARVPRQLWELIAAAAAVELSRTRPRAALVTITTTTATVDNNEKKNKQYNELPRFLHGLHGSGQAVDVVQLGEGLGRRGGRGLRLILPFQPLGVPLGAFGPLVGPLLLRVQLVPGRRLGHLLLLLLLLVRLRAARARARTPTEPKLMGQLGTFDHSAAARPIRSLSFFQVVVVVVVT